MTSLHIRLVSPRTSGNEAKSQLNYKGFIGVPAKRYDMNSSPAIFLSQQESAEPSESSKLFSAVEDSFVKGRVSRFGACASDNVSAVKPIVFGPIRSEYTTPAGYGGQVL